MLFLKKIFKEFLELYIFLINILTKLERDFRKYFPAMSILIILNSKKFIKNIHGSISWKQQHSLSLGIFLRLEMSYGGVIARLYVLKNPLK